MIGKDHFKKINLFYITVIISLISCRAEAVGGVEIINKTGVELKAVGTFVSPITKECSGDTELINLTVKKDKNTTFFAWDRGRVDSSCTSPHYYELKDIVLYKGDAGNPPLASISVSSKNVMFSVIGRLALKNSSLVNIGGKNTRLTIESNCFGDTRKKKCQLILQR